MSWVLLAGSLAGVLGLAAFAWLLGLGGAKLESEQEAMEIAEAELPAFDAATAALSDDCESATVLGSDGRQVRIRRHGANFVAEPIIPLP